MQFELVAHCVQILSMDRCQHYDLRCVVGHVCSSQSKRPLSLAGQSQLESVVMFSVQNLSRLPVEMLEMVLIRTFLMLYSSDDGTDSVRSVQCRVFTVLCSVCWSWWNTLRGWPQSPTPHWIKHQIKKLMKRECSLI